MKKVIAFIVVAIIIVAGIVFFNKKKEVKNSSPIDDLVTTYSNYTFKDISNTIDMTIPEYEIKYDLTNERLSGTLNDMTIVAYLIDDYLHIMINDIDYNFSYLGEVDRIMMYKYCNCNDDCIKIVALTEEGTIYALDIPKYMSEHVTFEPIASSIKFTNIGYVGELNYPDICGINGLAATNSEKTVIFNDKLEVFNQDYYSYIGNQERTLYVYPDGSIKLYDNDVFNNIDDIKIKEAFLGSDDLYYVIGTDDYLYKIENYEAKKINNTKVVKIGARTKDDAVLSIIVIFEDATAKKFDLNEDYLPLH